MKSNPLNLGLFWLKPFFKNAIFIFVTFCSFHVHSAPNINFCADLLREIQSPSLSELINSRRDKFAKLVVGEENGRIVSSSTFLNPLVTFEDVMGIKRAAPKTLTREERLEISGGLLAPVPTLLETIKKLYPLLGMHESTLRTSLATEDPREKHYNLHNASNAYIVFNDYHNSMSDALRQLVTACEALRKLIPQQDLQMSLEQFSYLKKKYDNVSQHMINLETAAIHHIVPAKGSFNNPYENYEDLMTSENLQDLFRYRDFDRFLMTTFLYERIYFEIDALNNDLNL